MAAKKSSQSKNKAGWILFIVTVIVLAVCILIIKFPPRIKDGAWHDERRIVFIAKGVLYGAVFALVGLVATNGMSKKDVLLIPVPVMVGLLPVILAVVGLIYGFRKVRARTMKFHHQLKAIRLYISTTDASGGHRLNRSAFPEPLQGLVRGLLPGRMYRRLFFTAKEAGTRR